MLSILLKCGFSSGLSIQILSFQLLLWELNMKEVYTVTCMRKQHGLIGRNIEVRVLSIGAVVC